LPYVVATLIFVLTATVTRQLADVKIPRIGWTQNPRWQKIWTAAAALAIIAAVALSGWPTWWGALMQGAAFVCGFITGRMMRRDIAPTFIAIMAMVVVTIAMLMQPEYFRFGQLGNLTVVHLGWLVITGAAAMATLAIRYIPSRDRIHHSAFVKLKWMMRFVTCFALVLFALTESVPVFTGLLAALFILFAMSVWHATRIPEKLGEQMWAITLMTFGVLTVMPVISALGILIWPRATRPQVWNDGRFLL
ncbi:MAG: hypothetical protein K2L94_02235, partial [Alphaproteobacteria bacterium]|nr:hypothetical protein [Alphaproteobacteria bacterium]